MKWRGYRQSGNVEDRRGMGGIGLAGGGIGAVVLAVVAMLFGINPGDVVQQRPAERAAPPAADDTLAQFASTVLASTEDVWGGIFKQSGEQYPAPALVLFSGATQSACGFAQSAMGPFYCSQDQKVYLDLSFFADLHDRFGAQGGDFAEAYVIAHEVGHHVQDVTGHLAHGGGNEASVQQELQADCLAGIWGYYAKQQQQLVEPDDLGEALDAASAIGDDRLQKQSQGYVVPESFTHGSSAQRVAAFKKGFDTGDLRQCGM